MDESAVPDDACWYDQLEADGGWAANSADSGDSGEEGLDFLFPVPFLPPLPSQGFFDRMPHVLPKPVISLHGRVSFSVGTAGPGCGSLVRLQFDPAKEKAIPTPCLCIIPIPDHAASTCHHIPWHARKIQPAKMVA